jgi:MoaA/NifB/PqqE/SkfB family radical SAM enzyme
MELEPVIHLTKACNHKCIFCSRKDDPPESNTEIKEIIKNYKYTITFEGGEPTLSKNLIKWIKYAKKRKVRELMLVTNGFSLDKKENVEKLVKAGVDIFNINFPSHIEKIYDILTGSKNYHKTIKAMENIIEIAGYEKLRLTYVINSLNYRYLKGYANFLKKKLGKLFYVEINMIKILGRVRNRLWLVPKLSLIKKSIYEGFSEFEKKNINFIVDGIPLCYMKNFEDKNIDVFNLMNGGSFSVNEKRKTIICRNCDIKEICSGPRIDYVSLYGYDELKPVKNKKLLGQIKKKLLNQHWNFN